MTDLTLLAKGKPCLVRVPTICNSDPATTVHAHVRLIGFSGMSYKINDWFGAWACSACHDYVDGRVPTIDDYANRRHLLLEGMVRTQHELLKLGHLPEAERVTE